MKKTATRSSPREAAATEVVPARFSADAAPAEANDDLGHRLKRVRTDKGWTLKEVSERTGVARSTLSKIENGQMSPTYDVLQKITRGIDLDIVELFDQRRQNAPVGRRSVTRSGEGKPHRTGTYDFEVLATDLSQKHILPFKARIRARRLDEFPGWVRHEGEEFLCVLSGSVQVFTEFYAPVTLGVGDSTYFDSKMGHAVVSLSKEDAEVIWICTGITALS
ncbi:XRE family transcriptional regulator [Bradyrhizobium sp. SSUT18]|uniref:helix-turn-helix domain-containing protein n=1 Tax=unclassified Bradyrhizobium TaxID=2631580 RepID=UPI00244CE5F0|nr:MULTISPECIES: XRE family transcriptional regulator [unclassified Bradyrhizobium]MDH2346076.1 XRE family transcriptional regulator [Bradyrhizobium sp. SSUT77]MDH2349652.1 XRE family transcriptional regulator [Bradyrhizobium sp. SSUT112]MDH2401222.1 XRE family transcriptional regulator [Bradyrhizobium sp. SSUT18]